jgi:hypothetical protein
VSEKREKLKREPLPYPWPEPERRGHAIEPDDPLVPRNARLYARRALDLGWRTVVLTHARGMAEWTEQPKRGDPSAATKTYASTRVVDSVMLWLDDGYHRACLAWEDGRAAGASIDGRGSVTHTQIAQWIASIKK